MVVSIVRVLSADIKWYIERGNVARDDSRVVGSIYQLDERLEAGIEPSERRLERGVRRLGAKFVCEVRFGQIAGEILPCRTEKSVCDGIWRPCLVFDWDVWVVRGQQGWREVELLTAPSGDGERPVCAHDHVSSNAVKRVDVREPLTQPLGAVDRVVIPGYREYWYSLLVKTLKECPAPFFVGFASRHGLGMVTVLVDHVTKR
nr:hypothetical protein [Halomicroarcula amylolytica]